MARRHWCKGCAGGRWEGQWCVYVYVYVCMCVCVCVYVYVYVCVCGVFGVVPPPKKKMHRTNHHPVCNFYHPLHHYAHTKPSV